MKKPIPFLGDKPRWIAALSALTAALGIPVLLGRGAGLSHNAAWLAAAGALYLAGKALLQEPDKRLRRWALGFGFAFALCQLAGGRLDAADTVGGLGYALLGLISAAALAPAAGFAFAALARLCRPRASLGEAARGKADPAAFWRALGLILLCWLPVYLAYYPGMFNFDAGRQLSQVEAGQFNTGLPLIHTLLLGGFYRLGQALGDVNIGIALYTAVQCLLLAGAMAYAVAYLDALGCPKGWRWACTLSFGLLPCFSLMAMSATKDLYFSGAVLVLMVKLHQLYRCPEKWREPGQWLAVAAALALICLFRSNGVSVAAALCLAIFIFLPSPALKRRALACVLCGLALFAGVSAGLKGWLHPGGSGLRESMSVPLSQLARVYTKAEESGEPLPEKAAIEGFIPDVHRYQRHLSDGVKYTATVGGVNMGEFLALWAKVGARYPAQYLDAFLYLNKGYWHLADTTHLDIYAERGDHGYMETKTHEGYGVERRSLLPGLMAWLDGLFVANGYLNVPLLSTVVESAFWCWLLWFAMALCWLHKRRDGLFASVMLLGLYASMLVFGPCAYFRYAYPLALCAPILLGAALCPARPEPTVQKEMKRYA